MNFNELYEQFTLVDMLQTLSEQTLLEKKEGFSDKEVKQMIKQYKENDDIDVRNDIVMGYLPLVTKVVSKNFSNVKGVDWDDLQQIGAMAVVKAIENFDYEHGAKFMSYLYKYIDGYIKNNQWKKDNMHFSLDAKMKSKDGDGDSFLDKMSDFSADTADTDATNNSSYDALNDGIAKLKPQAQEILRLHFGLETGQKQTLQQIGDTLGMTPQGVKAAVNRALKKLKKYIKI